MRRTTLVLLLTLLVPVPSAAQILNVWNYWGCYDSNLFCMWGQVWETPSVQPEFPGYRDLSYAFGWQTAPGYYLTAGGYIGGVTDVQWTFGDPYYFSHWEQSGVYGYVPPGGTYTAPASLYGTFYLESDAELQERIEAWNQDPSISISPGSMPWGDPARRDDIFTFYVPRVDVTPEPATLLLLGTGLVGLAGLALRRRRGRRASGIGSRRGLRAPAPDVIALASGREGGQPKGQATRM